jgi:N-acetylmuramoyl-L-alanine amidase
MAFQISTIGYWKAIYGTKKRKTIRAIFESMKNRFFLLTCLLLFSAGFTFAQSKQVVVVIDPGHGGKDVGHETTTDGHENEKHLNLKIAKFLGSYIEKYLDNVKVIYTRTADVFVSLDDRVAIANAAKADYFISIHCNGNESSSVRGTETHVHSMSATKSVKLAKAIEDQFSSRAGRHSRGVKDKDDLKHSIQVLKFTAMTSVLVECGFITNEKEAAYLNTTYGQEILASAIYRAFRDFIKKEHPSISFTGGSTTTTTESSGTNNSTSTSTDTYAIQIASSQEWIDTEDARFKSLGMTITRTKLNTTSAYKYIYTVGNYATKTDANAAIPAIKAKGYKDAIVVKR